MERPMNPAAPVTRYLAKFVLQAINVARHDRRPAQTPAVPEMVHPHSQQFGRRDQPGAPNDGPMSLGWDQHGATTLANTMPWRGISGTALGYYRES